MKTNRRWRVREETVETAHVSSCRGHQGEELHNSEFMSDLFPLNYSGVVFFCLFFSVAPRAGDIFGGRTSTARGRAVDSTFPDSQLRAIIRKPAGKSPVDAAGYFSGSLVNRLIEKRHAEVLNLTHTLQFLEV